VRIDQSPTCGGSKKFNTRHGHTCNSLPSGESTELQYKTNCLFNNFRLSISVRWAVGYDIKPNKRT